MGKNLLWFAVAAGVARSDEEEVEAEDDMEFGEDEGEDEELRKVKISLSAFTLFMVPLLAHPSLPQFSQPPLLLLILSLPLPWSWNHYCSSRCFVSCRGRRDPLLPCPSHKSDEGTLETIPGLYSRRWRTVTFYGTPKSMLPTEEVDVLLAFSHGGSRAIG